MIPTQRVFPNQLPAPYVFPNGMFNMALNPLRPAFPNMALNYQYNLPTFAPSVFPKMSDALSMLKLQKDLLTQINSLYPISLPKSEPTTLYSPPQQKNILSDSPIQLTKQELKTEPQTSMALPNDPEICFEAQIKYMIQFFVNSFGTATSQEINQTRQKYSHNPQLLQAFTALESKYTVTTKTREEMVKWVIRRCLKASKNSIKKGQKKDQKQALKDLCTRYFKDMGTDSNGEEDEGSESDMVSRVLPFRKNSKNRTMNSQFVSEIFQSEEFRVDYREFLKDLDDITDKENIEKLSKFSEFVVRCAKKQDFKSIAKYKRIPWLKVWLKNTKRIAEELDEGDYEGKNNKKMKST